MNQDYFFVVTDGHGYEVMSEKEVEAMPKMQLVSGQCDSYEEAKQLLQKGLADGSY